METRLPLVAIVGPTASGKTSLAIELAKKCNGEIICADSRTIYKYMDIGTAKPTIEDQARVPHWGLDIVEPGTRFTAADFKRYAVTKIDEIRARGHTPFIVGGTGLYINAVLYDYQFAGGYDELLREKLETLPIEELQDYCIKNNVEIPKNEKNKRYLIRAIEKADSVKIMTTRPLENTYVVGISSELLSDYDERIRRRSEQLFENGVVEEAIMLGKKYGWDSEAMTGNIYRLVKQYLDTKMSLQELMVRSIIADRQLAKRQMTWFKRDKNIKWLALPEAKKYLENILSEH